MPGSLLEFSGWTKSSAASRKIVNKDKVRESNNEAAGSKTNNEVKYITVLEAKFYFCFRLKSFLNYLIFKGDMYKIHIFHR